MTEKELIENRAKVIKHLVSPLMSVLDDSIGCALWFAGRAYGKLHNDENYKSPARVSLIINSLLSDLKWNNFCIGVSDN